MKRLTRREFGEVTVLGLGWMTLAGTAGMLTGCPGGDVVIAAVVAAAQVATSAAAILRPVNPSTASVLDVVAKDLLQVQNLYQQFETALSTAKPGLAGQIQAALGTITSNLTAILNAVKIANPTLVTFIQVGIAVVNSAITIILDHLPADTKAQVKVARAAFQPLPEVPGAKNASDLKKAWNEAAVANGHPEAQVK